MSGLLTKRTAKKKRGSVVGGVFCPIPSKTLLGLIQQQPYGPYCTWKGGHKSIFAKVMGLIIKSGSVELLFVITERIFVPLLGIFAKLQAVISP